MPPLEDGTVPSAVAPSAGEDVDLAQLTETGAFEDTRELEAPSPPLFGSAAVTADTPAPPNSPDEATDLTSLANLAAAVRSLDDRADEAAPAPAPAASPAASVPAPATLPPPPPGSSPAQPPPPAADLDTDALPVAVEAEAPVSSVFDGSFTAKGGGRPRRADTRPAKRGLFRR